MPNYKLVESWGRPNDQNREWLAQTEDDKTTLLIEQELHFGDKIQVVDPPKKYIIGEDGVAYDADEEEGGSTIRLQSKSVTITENGENTITYDSGYDGLSSVGVDVSVEPSLQTKSVTYSSNGEHTVTYDNDYDGLASVGVTVDVSPTLQAKSVKYTTNGNNTVTYDNGYDGLSTVGIEVDVDPILQAKSVTYTSNGEHTITYDSGYDGLSSVNISVSVRAIPPEVPEDAIICYSPEPFMLTTYNLEKHWDGSVFYSTDYSTWNTWNGAVGISAEKSGDWYKLYLRGASNTRLTVGNASLSPDPSGSWRFAGNSIKLCGNLNTLLSYSQHSSSRIIAAKAFSYLFYDASGVDFDVTLPSTSIRSDCYAHMFERASSLRKVPELPATTLYDSCYRNMFSNCPLITTAPALPATTLADNCYIGMFSNCLSLTTIPKLAATSLPANCYSGMFGGCGLIKISETQTDEYIYEYRIPAAGEGTAAATSSLYGMFRDTGGTFSGTPTINTTYYTSNAVISAE